MISSLLGTAWALRTEPMLSDEYPSPPGLEHAVFRKTGPQVSMGARSIGAEGLNPTQAVNCPCRPRGRGHQTLDGGEGI